MFDTLSRYILKRTTARFLLLFAVFMGVLVGGQVAILLGRGVPPEACLPMFQALSLLSLPVALPVALASAIMVVIGGMVQDGEFRALASSGVGHRRVLVRISPLILGAVLLCGLLTHVVMPLGIADVRANKAKLLQTGIASRVAEGESMLQDKDMGVWAQSAEGARLERVRALLTRGDEFIAIYAPRAKWVLAPTGIHLECEDVQMLVRTPGKQTMSLDTSRYAYLFDHSLLQRDELNPDSLPTWRVMELASRVPGPQESHDIYNNARLALQFRWFLPLSLIAFALLAMGLGLAFGTDQNLLGVIIIVVVVAAVVYPTFGYVKSRTELPQMNPGFLLWPPAVLVGLFGWWLTWRPEHAREVLAAPLTWLAGLRKGRA